MRLFFWAKDQKAVASFPDQANAPAARAYETLIIGGGPAGLAAACFSPGHTLLLERLPLAGRKLLATGGCRCNLTHAASAEEVAAAFGRNGRFAMPALSAFPPKAVCAFFREHGVETCEEPDGCVFPVSQKSADVLQALEQAARANGTEIRCGIRVSRLVVDDHHSGETNRPPRRVVAVETTAGIIRARRVVLAAGGQSYAALGSDGSGFVLAREAGLDVVPPVPALAGLVTSETWPGTLAGIVCERGGLRLDTKGASKQVWTGPLLFTHRGLSGPPALTLSGEIAARLYAARQEAGPDGTVSVPVRATFLASRSMADWLARFDEWRRVHGGRAVHNLLSGELPRGLACALCAQAGTEETPIARTSRRALEKLAECCANMPLTITATEGWDRAMLTRGGVALGELDPQTLACRRIAGLFCAGEVVDLDAPCGGYNLTWAFASGRLAGLGAKNPDENK